MISSRTPHRLLSLLTATLIGLCSAAASAQSADAPPVAVVFGNDVAPRVQARIAHLIRQVQPAAVILAADPVGSPVPATVATLLHGPGLLLAFGDSPLARLAISDADLGDLGAEGYIVRSRDLGAATLVATRGNPLAAVPGSAAPHANIGSHYGAYAALADLGFGFLRPLAPTLPAVLLPPSTPLEHREQPRWRIRATHIHTQHPLELTDVLQGWGKTGPWDSAGFAAMVPDWESYVEWLVANRQNRVEWPLLWADSWQDFADSSTRIERLKQLVDLGHDYGVAIGVDVPLTFQQQHSYRLLRHADQTPLAAQLAEIHASVDWLMGAGFDFFGTETGTTEFTHPAASSQLAWMNELAVYTSTAYHKPVYIKVHCSTGQTADGYQDPVTGGPLNFNMLPHYADSRLGVLPHTVEFYGLDDPAPTYGNENFAYMRDFLRREIGKREVVYYPETAYWVGFDIDVPLFLPIYGERRLHDLRLIAGDEDQGLTGSDAPPSHRGQRMDGQLNFSSGWEWGYWLNDVVAARAAWNPQPHALPPGASDTAAFQALTTEALGVFGGTAPAVAAWVADVAAAEKALLIDGRVHGQLPARIYERNGQAYLEGFQTLTDLSDLLTHVPGTHSAQTQPARLGTISGRSPFYDTQSPNYQGAVAPLLSEMETTFAALVLQGEQLQAAVPAPAQPLLADLLDAARMTALRARQQHGLYDYALGDLDADAKAERLGTARAALDQAADVVREREAHYAAPDVERISGWHSGPTSYQYGYLWTAHALYYWWRDEAKAVSGAFSAAQSPCYQNIIDPIDLGFGDGGLLRGSHALAALLPFSSLGNCLNVPTTEPHYPLDGMRP